MRRSGSRLRLGRIHQPDHGGPEIWDGSHPDSPRKLAPDVTFYGQDCSEPWPLPDDSLDVVFASNFFEHLPSKVSLGRTIDPAYRCGKPGGPLICLGPDIKLLPGAYWDFWDHYLPLTEASLGEGMRLAGFEIETEMARFLPYSMSQGFAPPLFFVHVYLRLPKLWRFFGRHSWSWGVNLGEPSCRNW